ncbi:MAG: hypothetical protein A2328_03960 [Bdellovibrionales bacterium RIFOXYB2_FULL_36_6]|nr:MAG: hypothetical protein A2328_03960 [Bdellovibrionales bacterium RIFOXYB2_FULL_36_6]
MEKENEVRINSWNEYENVLRGVFDNVAKRRERDKNIDIPDPLFRGQSCAKWNLETTLDRIASTNVPYKRYFYAMQYAQRPIESYLSQSWDLSNYAEPDIEIATFSVEICNLEFMIYLRHHQFPSPLLDWTKSPYIAAFFAFNTAPLNEDDVAVFVYHETKDGHKQFDSNNPSIYGVQGNIKKPIRHYSQQSVYTVCLQKPKDQLIYAEHNKVFELGRGKQDVVTKYLLSKTLQNEFLKKLELMNINKYSLFNDEDSLVQTLSNKVFIIEKF